MASAACEGPFYSLWMNTMKRCFDTFAATRRGVALSIGLLALGFAASTHAQGVVLNFPDTALRCTMEVGQPPWITMGGRLSLIHI